MTRFCLSSMFVCAAVVAQAQPTRQYASRPVAPTASTEAEAAYRTTMGQMRSDLRNLITAQELYQTGNQKFAGDIDLLPTFHPIPGAHIEIISADAQGWAATESMPTGAGLGRTCVIWVGAIATGDRPATEAER